MGNIIPFSAEGALPAHLQDFQASTALVTAGGFPVVSIKGKNFHIIRGDDKTLIKNKDGDPASSIEVCIVAYNPSVSRTFYQAKYTDGSVEKPDCYSDDGKTPAADCESPQSKQCATCPQNQWGARITEDGKKAKNCAETRRIAIARPNQINDPMLLRVPTTSLKALGDYSAMLGKRRVGVEAVVTKIRFDHDKAYPSLIFEPVGWVDEETANAIREQKGELVTQQIIGLAVVEAAPELPELPFAPPAEATLTTQDDGMDADDEEDEAPAAPVKKVAKKKAVKKTAPAPKPEPEEASGDDEILDAIDAVFGA